MHRTDRIHIGRNNICDRTKPVVSKCFHSKSAFFTIDLFYRNISKHIKYVSGHDQICCFFNIHLHVVFVLCNLIQFFQHHAMFLYQPLCIHRIKKLCQLYSLLFCRFQLI